MAKIRVKNKAEYQEYLKSPAWQATRKRLYKAYEFKCSMCGSPKNLRVHHITYENLGEEKDEDLTVLCQKCHSQVHDGEYTFFDDLCLAWSRLYDKIEAETNEDKKGEMEVQLAIIDRAMDFMPRAGEIYRAKKRKGEGECITLLMKI